MTLLFTLWSAGNLQPQEPSRAFEGKPISGIVLMGNEQTRDQVIFREMKTRVGDPYISTRIESDRKRIQNLALFTRVEILPAAAPNDSVTLVILVAERWNFLPYPLFFRNERSWDKWSYGAGIIHNNIAGLNQKLVAELWLGYNPGGQFAYSNPWFGGGRHFYSKLQVLAITARSKSLLYPRFDEQHRGLSYAFGKQWGYHTFTSAAVGYDHIRFPAEYQRLLPSGKTEQQVPSFGVGFLYDTRDLYEYPRSGWYVNVYATQSYYPAQLAYLFYGTDCRSYIKLTDAATLALRFAFDLSSGSVPVFAHQYLGYTERVRGHFNEQREGDNRALFSAELRFPILPIRYLDLSGSGLFMGKYQRDLPFGISGGIFIDAGDIWLNEAASSQNNRMAGYGLGLHFHLPYVDVLRLEYAFDFHGRPEWIFDLQVAF